LDSASVTAADRGYEASAAVLGEVTDHDTLALAPEARVSDAGEKVPLKPAGSVCARANVDDGQLALLRLLTVIV